MATLPIESVIGDLDSLLTSVPSDSRDFAAKLVKNYKRYKNLSSKQAAWARILLSSAVTGKTVKECADAYFSRANKSVTIENADGLFSLLKTAAKNLKYPKLVLNVGEDTFRLKLCSNKTKRPGDLAVDNGESWSSYNRKFFGYISKSGKWDYRSLSDDKAKEVATKFTEFADNPAAVASDFGNLTGNCCFCLKTLTDPNSIAVGYGPVCAGNYGLPWGNSKLTEALKEAL